MLHPPRARLSIRPGGAAVVRLTGCVGTALTFYCPRRWLRDPLPVPRGESSQNGTRAHPGAAARSHQAVALNVEDANPTMISQLIARAATNPAVTAHEMRPLRRSRAKAEPTAATRNSACIAASRIAVSNGVVYPPGLPSGPNVVAIRSGKRSHQTLVTTTSTTTGNAAAMAARTPTRLRQCPDVVGECRTTAPTTTSKTHRRWVRSTARGAVPRTTPPAR